MPVVIDDPGWVQVGVGVASMIGVAIVTVLNIRSTTSLLGERIRQLASTLDHLNVKRDLDETRLRGLEVSDKVQEQQLSAIEARLKHIERALPPLPLSPPGGTS